MTQQTHTYAIAAARLLMVAIFILSGLSKIGAAETTAGYMEAMGVPGILLWPTILFEIGAGLLIAAGFHTRSVAALLSAFCIVTAVLFHRQISDQIQLIMLLKNVTMAGGFILLSAVGPGALSVDASKP